MKRKKQTQLIRWLNDGIFPVHILFSVGFSYDEIIKHCKKLKANDWVTGLSQDKQLIDSGTCFGLGRTIENTKSGKEVHLFYIIITRHFDFSDWDMVMLAHEILHICQFMLPKILNRDNEIEAEAYLHSHIMTQCLKELRS
jgi:hypothetical protein